MDTKDHYRAAKILIESYGGSAEAEAEQRMQRMIRCDDAKGAANWLAIGQAISDLRQMTSKQVH